jgi:hypothetical protein
MARNSLILALVARVGEHLAALGCVDAGQLYLAHFGMDIRRWPLLVLVVIIVAIYGLGLVSARYVSRLWRKHGLRGKPIQPAGAPAPVPVASSRARLPLLLLGGALLGGAAVLIGSKLARD